MEASAIYARAGLGRSRLTLTTPLLRLRSDQQLVGLFRSGNDDAFRVIHDRYRARLLAYVRHMLAGASPDAEDVLQDVFVRAYSGLRANGGQLTLRPWLYRVAHNRCVDELRRPMPPAPETTYMAPPAVGDPALESERRESLRRLITDIRRLPDQQRSALLMREMSGMAYTEVACVLGLSIPAVKSLLVRARLSLAAALEAREKACHEIRAELVDAHERGVRASGLARRHLRDCPGCREYRAELRCVSRQLAALTPSLGPLAGLARLIGAGSGGGAAAGGTGSGVLAAGSAASAGSTALGAAATHVAAVVAAAVVTAGGAVEIQHTVATQIDPAPVHHHAKRSAGVGQGTSIEGTVAASAAAPLAPSAPPAVQQASPPAGNAQQSPQAGRPKHSGKTVKAVTRQTTAPAPTATDTTAATSTSATTDSATAGTSLVSCQSPAGASLTLPDSSTSNAPPPCAPSTGTAASTTPTSSPTGSAPTGGTNGIAGTAGSPTPTSGSPPSTPQAPSSQAQKS